MYSVRDFKEHFLYISNIKDKARLFLFSCGLLNTTEFSNCLVYDLDIKVFFLIGVPHTLPLYFALNLNTQ